MIYMHWLAKHPHSKAIHLRVRGGGLAGYLLKDGELGDVPIPT